jgi:hypothetical protein
MIFSGHFFSTNETIRFCFCFYSRCRLWDISSVKHDWQYRNPKPPCLLLLCHFQLYHSSDFYCRWTSHTYCFTRPTTCTTKGLRKITNHDMKIFPRLIAFIYRRIFKEIPVLRIASLISTICMWCPPTIEITTMI